MFQIKQSGDLHAILMAIVFFITVTVSGYSQAFAQGAPQPANIEAEHIQAAPIDPEIFARGETLYNNKCARCHAIKPEATTDLGPSLQGIFGAMAGQRADFEYSEAMLNSGIVWDAATLDALIRKPKRLVPKTSMIYWGMRKNEDRAALVLYLQHVTQ